MSHKATVGLCQGAQRTANLRCALERVIDDIDWSSRQHVVVKPNLVMPDRPQAITHRDTLDVVLEAVRGRYGGMVTVAEGCALDSTMEAFQALGFDHVAAFYSANLVDLNADEAVPVTVYDRGGGPLRVRVARSILDSDCRISLSLPKTHDVVLVTLSIKNLVMGSLVNRRMAACVPPQLGGAGGQERPAWQDRLGQLIRGHGNGWGSDKTAMHQGYPMMNINLALLASLLRPDLSILDGFVAMEGAGPTDGTRVPWRIAVAGTDPLAVDSVTAHLMGFAAQEVGYLHYCSLLGLGCADPEQVEVLGNVTLDEVRRTFTPHPRHHEQRAWHHPDAERLLQRHAMLEKVR